MKNLIGIWVRVKYNRWNMSIRRESPGDDGLLIRLSLEFSFGRIKSEVRRGGSWASRARWLTIEIKRTLIDGDVGHHVILKCRTKEFNWIRRTVVVDWAEYWKGEWVREMERRQIYCTDLGLIWRRLGMVEVRCYWMSRNHSLMTSRLRVRRLWLASMWEFADSNSFFLRNFRLMAIEIHAFDITKQ